MKTLLSLITLLVGPLLAAQQGWRLELSDEVFLQRLEANAEVFNGQMWTFNGGNGGATTTTTASVWGSADGNNWQLKLAQIPWPADIRSSSAVFNGRLWKFGGNGGNIYSNEVWSTDDGVNWVAEPNAQWAGRGGHSTIVFNAKLWVLGGYSLQAPGSGVFNDVWSSPDGVNWTQEVAVAPWPAQSFHTSVVFDNRMWVIGGGAAEQEVWSSPDGVNWTLETDSAPWPPVAGHTSVVYHGRMWVVGGLTVGNQVLNQAWSSVDGVNWVLESPNAPWGRRAKHASVVFNHRMWIMGGSGDFQSRPDIWSYGLHIAPEALPPGIIEVPYTSNIQAREGDGPYTWSLIGGALPPGFTLDLTSTAGTIPLNGTPEQTGKFAFKLRVEDQTTGDWAEQQVTLKINSQPSEDERGANDSLFAGCASHPAPQIPAAILLAATATTALACRRRSRFR
jgi:hypothetical protein